MTARLSQKFYETFGEAVTNELVDWFNTVDATYRADLDRINDLNFARFDAKIGERIAELRGALKAELAQRLGDLKSDLLRWMFGFWASVVVALAVLALRR